MPECTCVSKRGGLTGGQILRTVIQAMNLSPQDSSD